jgi:hypothetical protein
MPIRVRELVPPAATPDELKHELRLAVREGRVPRRLVTRAMQQRGLWGLRGSTPSASSTAYMSPAAAQARAAAETAAANAAGPALLPLFDAGEQQAAEEDRLEEYLADRDGSGSAPGTRMAWYVGYGLVATALGLGAAYLLFGSNR